jgi:5-dehydro-2-deoxygluconokinase
MFGWGEDLTPEQTAEIAGAKQVIYDGFKAAIEAGAPKKKVGILVDEQFGSAVLRDAAALGYIFAYPLLSKKITREDAVAGIARRYREFVDIFESVRARTRAA